MRRRGTSTLGPCAGWRARRGWLRWLGLAEWDTGHLDAYGRPIRRCTRCGCLFVQPSCPSLSHPENNLPVAGS